MQSEDLFADVSLDALTIFRKRLEDAMSDNARFEAECMSAGDPPDKRNVEADLLLKRIYALTWQAEQERTEREIKTRAFSDALRQGRVPEHRLAPVSTDRWE